MSRFNFEFFKNNRKASISSEDLIRPIYIFKKFFFSQNLIFQFSKNFLLPLFFPTKYFIFSFFFFPVQTFKRIFYEFDIYKLLRTKLKPRIHGFKRLNHIWAYISCILCPCWNCSPVTKLALTRALWIHVRTYVTQNNWMHFASNYCTVYRTNPKEYNARSRIRHKLFIEITFVLIQ